MAARKLKKTRKALLIALESIIGNECYNPSIRSGGTATTALVDVDDDRLPARPFLRQRQAKHLLDGHMQW